MSKLVRILLLIVLVFTSTVFAVPAGAAAPKLLPVPGPCVEGVLPGGALSLICVPTTGWNGELVVYAHGYVAYNQPLGFYNLSLDDGTYLPDLIQTLGFAFATTSYRRNGLAIVEGVDDVRNLVTAFKTLTGRTPRRTYITGPSEGGAVAALSVERSADLFSGGLSLCGPVGDFKSQIDYWGDFRVLFDYFFPGALPPSPVDIPQNVIDTWDNFYAPQIDALVSTNPSAASQLIATSKAATDPANPATVNQTTLNILWYNVFATNDGKAQLGGNPYGNIGRVYSGSADDAALNAGVARIAADASALANIPPYNTSGRVRVPLVTMHTTGDEVVPFWHQVLYRKKLVMNGSLPYVTQIPIARYGHCNFTTVEVLAAFGILVLQTTGQGLQNVPAQYNIAPVQSEMRTRAGRF